MPSPRLYLDEDVSPLPAVLLRGEGFDVVSAHEIGAVGWSDERQFDHAISDRRAIFTYNVRHFDRIAREAVRNNTDHFGILVSHEQYDSDAVALLVRRLTLYLTRHDAAEVEGTYLVLPVE